MFFLLLSLFTAPPEPVTVIRCDVKGDPHARTYELQRHGDANAPRWALAMRSREAGSSAVMLPLPDARPSIGGTRASLEYRTLNGGREVRWTVEPAGATLDVHANFELEVNVEADLDPRVELMNTGGALSNLACTLTPPA